MAKRTAPKKKLAKRDAPKPATEGNGSEPVDAVGNTPAAAADLEAVCADHDAQDEEDDRKPKKRNNLPAGKIGFTCACGSVCTIYVDDPAAFDEKARIALFKKRGSCYKPPTCRWCVNRLSAEERRKLA